MDLYHVALFVHILALLAAASASTLLHFCFGRLERTGSASEARQWYGLISKTTRVFPAALVTFFVTGGYMISKTWTWRLGWIETGVLGAVLLLVNGILIGARTKPLMELLQTAGSGAVPPQASALIHDPVVHTLPWVNTAIAYGVVLVMVTKPGLAGGSVMLLGAIALGLAVAARTRAGARAAQVASETA